MQQDLTVEYGFRRVIVTITAVCCALLEIVDTTIINVALNEMRGSMGATLSEIGWVITAYAIGNVIVVPLTSFLSQQFGRSNYFAASIVLFTICSFLCGNATTMWELVLFRFLQGVGGGALLVTSQTIITEAYPLEKRGMAQAIYGLGVIVGPTLGPPLGGYIVEHYSWPYIFYINLPIGVIATMLTLTYIKSPKYGEKQAASQIDWWGIVFLAGAVGSLQFVLERGQEEDWFSSGMILGFAILCGICAYLFIWRELTYKNPIVELRVLKNSNLRVGTILSFILGFGLYGSTFIIPLYTQNSLGWTAYQAGLLMVPSSLMTAFMMPIIGQAIQRGVRQKYLAASGMFLFFIFCMWGYHILTPDTGDDAFFWMLMLRGLAMSMLFIPVTTLSLSTLRGKQIGQGAAFTGMMRQLGGSFGIALITTFMTRQNALHRNDMIGYINPENEVFQQKYQGMVANFMQHGMAANEARAAALHALDGSIMGQAAVLSYMDVFLYIGIMFLICVPFILMLKNNMSTDKIDVSAAH
ncbi:DHA2 family efflux MFS transporter permease subunit [Parapedobacter lycopersici]|uniref:DHA2 family efflux MFS transporter permease subunit n=1 Tax=Parapedobacter lycopersici TaxID=1864939 RepID=UPI00214D994D|nr:DHA2 family efflux MFS transporter permease subunit [Parapedobacter lycopersici]